MNTAKLKKHLALLLISALGFVHTVGAATITLATSPVANLSTTVVHPNIMFVLDNSGSMAWNYLPDYVSNGSAGTGSSICWNGYNDSNNLATCAGAGAVVNAATGSSTSNVPFTSSAVNYIYYNPNITYAAPVKANGTSYPNITPSAAYADGFAATGSTNLATSYTSNATAAAGSTSVTLSSTAGLAVGQAVSGSGVAPGTFLVTTSNPVTFSKPVTLALAGSPVTFTSGTYAHQIWCSTSSPTTVQKYSAQGNTNASTISTTGTATVGSANVTVASTTGLFVGMTTVTGTAGIAVGANITAINGSVVTLSSTATATTLSLQFAPVCMENGNTSNSILYPLNQYTNVSTYTGAPYYYTMSPMEYCTDSTYAQCVPTADAAHSTPAVYRWCNTYDSTNHLFPNTYNNSGVITNNCQDLHDQTHTIPDYLGGVSPASASAVKAFANLVVNSYNPGLQIGGSGLAGITVNGNPIMLPTTVLTAGSIGLTSTSLIAGALNTAINAYSGTSGFSSTVSGSTLTITSNTPGASFNGQQVVVNGPPLVAGANAVGSITITDAASGKVLNQISINGNSLLTSPLTATGVLATTAQSICNAINAGPSKAIYKANSGTPAPAFGTCLATSNIVRIERLTQDAVDNGQAIILSPLAGTAAVAATGTITINAQGALGSGLGTEIEDVTLNGTSILLTKPFRYTGAGTPSQIASALYPLLTANPTGFTKQAYGGGNTITYAASPAPGTAPTIIVTANGQTASPATATITVGGNSVSNHGDLGGITAGATNITGHLDQTVITNDNSSNAPANATSIKNAINGSSTGYSATCTGGATCTGSTVTVSAPVGTAYNGQAVGKLAGAPSTGFAATGSITITTGTSSSQQTEIDDVTFNGTSILTTKPITFPSSQSVNQIANALNSKLSNPTGGWTHSVSPAGSGTIAFTQSPTVGGTAPAILAPATGIAAIQPTATITVGGNASASNAADLGGITANGIQLFNPTHLTITNDSSGNSSTNANAITAAIIANKATSGYTAGQSGSTITVTPTPTGPYSGSLENGKSLLASPADNTVTGQQAKVSINITASGTNTEIDDVTFNGTSILTTKPITFASTLTPAQIASNLSGALSNPIGGWTHTATGNTITFTQTAMVTGAMPTVIVSGSPGVASATTTIAVSGDATNNKGNLGGIKAGSTTIANAITSAALTSVNSSSAGTNASVIASAINTLGTGYSANASGTTVTVTAPAGAAANGNTLSFTAGTPTSGNKAAGSIILTSTGSATPSVIQDITINGTSILASASKPLIFPFGTQTATNATTICTAIQSNAGTSGYGCPVNSGTSTVNIVATTTGTASNGATIAVTSTPTTGTSPTAAISFTSVASNSPGNVTISAGSNNTCSTGTVTLVGTASLTTDSTTCSGSSNSVKRANHFADALYAANAGSATANANWTDASTACSGTVTYSAPAGTTYNNWYLCRTFATSSNFTSSVASPSTTQFSGGTGTTPASAQPISNTSVRRGSRSRWARASRAGGCRRASARSPAHRTSSSADSPPTQSRRKCGTSAWTARRRSASMRFRPRSPCRWRGGRARSSAATWRSPPPAMPSRRPSAAWRTPWPSGRWRIAARTTRLFFARAVSTAPWRRGWRCRTRLPTPRWRH